MFEDSTYLNRELQKALKARSEVESAWIMGGTVYMKLKDDGRPGKKIKVLITDDLDTVILKHQKKLREKPSISSSPVNTEIKQTTQETTDPPTNGIFPAPASTEAPTTVDKSRTFLI